MAGFDLAISQSLYKCNATIANGQSLSDAIPLKGYVFVGIQMPASWTGANLTLQASADGGVTFANVYDNEGTEFEISADASRFIRLDPAVMAPFDCVKVRSGTSGSPTNQGGARTLMLVGRVI